MPNNSCWGKFFSCCQKTGVVFNEVASVVEGLVNQAELFINILVAANVIDRNNDDVVKALQVLATTRSSLKLADGVVSKLKKYIPDDLAKVPDLNGDGRVNAEDLVILLSDGQETLNQLISDGFVTQENAAVWQRVFVELIAALKQPTLRSVTGQTFAAAKTTLGPQAIDEISARLKDRKANERYISRTFPERSKLIESNAKLKQSLAAANDMIVTMTPATRPRQTTQFDHSQGQSFPEAEQRFRYQ
jgi:hypothetical protein